MTFTLMMLAILVLGVILAVIGGVLLFLQKSKLAGFIVLGVGLLTTLLSIIGVPVLGDNHTHHGLNWSSSMQLEDHIRENWIEKHSATKVDIAGVRSPVEYMATTSYELFRELNQPE